MSRDACTHVVCGLNWSVVERLHSRILWSTPWPLRNDRILLVHHHGHALLSCTSHHHVGLMHCGRPRALVQSISRRCLFAKQRSHVFNVLYSLIHRPSCRLCWNQHHPSAGTEVGHDQQLVLAEGMPRVLTLSQLSDDYDDQQQVLCTHAMPRSSQSACLCLSDTPGRAGIHLPPP